MSEVPLVGRARVGPLARLYSGYGVCCIYMPAASPHAELLAVLSLSLSLSFFLSFTYSLSLSLARARALSLSVSRALFLSLSLPLSLHIYFPASLSRALSRSESLSRQGTLGARKVDRGLEQLDSRTPDRRTQDSRTPEVTQEQKHD